MRKNGGCLAACSHVGVRPYQKGDPRLYARHPDATLYGIRIGYNVAAALGGVMERTGS